MNDRCPMDLRDFLECGGVAILRVNERDELLPRRAISEPPRKLRARDGRNRFRQIEDEIGDICGPRPCRTSTHSATSSALPTVRPSGSSIGVSRCDIFTPIFLPTLRHRGRELLRLRSRFHERAAAEFHIEHQPIETFRELLAHDAGDDERLRRHRAGHIAQRVEFLVGRDRCRRSARS